MIPLELLIKAAYLFCCRSIGLCKLPGFARLDSRGRLSPHDSLLLPLTSSGFVSLPALLYLPSFFFPSPAYPIAAYP